MFERSITQLCRQLRQQQTPSEKLLWQELRCNEFLAYKFKRQHPFIYQNIQGKKNFFIADFYCPARKALIELDGPIHDFQKDYDRNRDEVLALLGLRTLRIKNEELESNGTIYFAKNIGFLEPIGTQKYAIIPSLHKMETGAARSAGGVRLTALILYLYPTTTVYRNMKLKWIPPLLCCFITLSAFAQKEYTSLDEALKNPLSVKVLNLKGKGLTAIPESIGSLTNLQKLDLSANKLTSLPKSIASLKTLKYLNLTSNKLTALPVAVCSLKNLEELEIAFNQITALPKEFGQLTKLNRFAAAKNSLKTLPAEMSKLSSLTIIDFSYNQFTTLPVELMEVKNLKALDVSFNKMLSAIPKEIKNLQALRLLNIATTKITKAQVEDLTWLIPDCRIMQ